MYPERALKVTLNALDDTGIDILEGSDLAAAEAQVQTLREKLREINAAALNAAVDPGPMHPAHDTWDDHTWFQKMAASSGGVVAQQELRELTELLERSAPQAVTSMCDIVLYVLHDYIKLALNLVSSTDRNDRPPTAPRHAGVADAHLIWEARNQVQHWSEPANTPWRQPVVDAFKVMVEADQELFGWVGSSPASREGDLRTFMKEKSYSRECLIFLGLTDKFKIEAVLPTL